MRGIPFYFFLAGALCVSAGMLWGITMASSGNHTLAGAHAHLNLVGWVTLALFGIYYQLTPQAAASRLAPIHLIVAVLGAVVLVSGIAMAIMGKGETAAIIGSLLTALSMLIFLITLIRKGFGPKM